jgi:hypothetical protein
VRSASVDTPERTVDPGSTHKLSPHLCWVLALVLWQTYSI